MKPSGKGREPDYPTLSKPVQLFIGGNDDTSYSKFYAIPEEVFAELELYLDCQPLDFHKDLIDMGGWVFTN